MAITLTPSRREGRYVWVEGKRYIYHNKRKEWCPCEECQKRLWRILLAIVDAQKEAEKRGRGKSRARRLVDV